ncbi:hypothetical protein EDB89DRAFT_1902618 [Lactarius sanguifluus]|nr:hypothetical protein EDB89DRAFT_1902618 [Lactarius sanguifluus]
MSHTDHGRHYALTTAITGSAAACAEERDEELPRATPNTKRTQARGPAAVPHACTPSRRISRPTITTSTHEDVYGISGNTDSVKGTTPRKHAETCAMLAVRQQCANEEHHKSKYRPLSRELLRLAQRFRTVLGIKSNLSKLRKHARNKCDFTLGEER